MSLLSALACFVRPEPMKTRLPCFRCILLPLASRWSSKLPKT